MAELVIPKPMIWLPRYARPGKSGGLIPPSPPAESRQRREKAILRAVRSFTGRLPDGWQAMARIGTPGSMTGGMASMSGVETQLFGANIPPLPSGALAYWKFDNNLNDSVASLNLTGVGTPTYVSGKIGAGEAVHFITANQQYVYVNSSSVLQLSSSKTLAGWIYVTSVASSYYVMGKMTSVSMEYDVHCDASYNFTWGIVNTNGQNQSQSIGSGPLSQNAWHYFVLGYDDSGIRLGTSLDGSNMAFSSTTIYHAQVSTQTFYIGTCFAFGSPTNYMTGSFDGWGMWDHLWSNTEIGQGWNSGNGTDGIYT